MIYISHRGNISGKNLEKENHPDYILSASKKYFVEIDVWFIDNKFILGHDKPDYEIKKSFLKNKKYWCHAKNINALFALLKNKNNCFYHNVDDCVLTSNGYIWTFPGKILTEKSIAVLPENVNWIWGNLDNCYGICSDFIEK